MKENDGLYISTDSARIIENTKEARESFGHNYGSQTDVLNDDLIEALLKGKCIAILINGGEYTQFLIHERSLKHE